MKNLVTLPASLQTAYEYLHPLNSQGAEADMYLIRHRPTEELRVLKYYRHHYSPKEEILAFLPQHGIPSLIHVFQTQPRTQTENAWEVMEYLPEGSLLQWLKKQPKPLNEKIAYSLFKQAIEAIDTLHQHGIFHRDIKPDNFLIQTQADGTIRLVLMDFGLASYTKTEDHITNKECTVRYAPPEAFTGLLTEKADWWTLGMLFLEMFEEEHPFKGLSEAQILFRLQGLDQKPIQIKKTPSWRWTCLLKGLLTRHPETRWGIKEIQAWLEGQMPSVNDLFRPEIEPFKAELCCKTPAQLIRTLTRQWQMGLSVFANGRLAGWFRYVLKDHLTAEKMESFSTHQSSGSILFNFLMLLETLDEDFLIHAEEGIRFFSETLEEEESLAFYVMECIDHIKEKSSFLSKNLQALWAPFFSIETQLRHQEKFFLDEGAPRLMPLSAREETAQIIQIMKIAYLNQKDKTQYLTQLRHQIELNNPPNWYEASLSSPERLSPAFLLIALRYAPLAKKERDQRPLDNSIKTHTGWVNGLAISPCGEWLATAGHDEEVHLIELKTQQHHYTLKGHGHFANCVAFSPSGEFLVSGGGDNTLIIWNWRFERALTTLIGHSDYINSVEWSRCGEWILSASGDASIKQWSAKTGELQRTWKQHSDAILGLALNAEGTLCASASTDKTIRLWQVSTGECIATLKGHQRSVKTVAFSQKGDWLLSGSADNTLKMWDLKTFSAFATLEGHRYAVNSVAFSSDGAWFASGSQDLTVKLWRTTTLQCEKTFTEHENSIYTIVFDQKYHRLLSGSADGTTRFWALPETA